MRPHRGLAAVLAHRFPTRRDAPPLCTRCGMNLVSSLAERSYYSSPNYQTCFGPYSKREKRTILEALDISSCVVLGCGDFHVASCVHFSDETDDEPQVPDPGQNGTCDRCGRKGKVRLARTLNPWVSPMVCVGGCFDKTTREEPT